MYSNILYQAVSPEQEIYVPLNVGNFRQPEEYQMLGFEHIPLIGDYGMLYGKKGRFDELREELRLEVAHPFVVPILSHTPCAKEVINTNFTYHISPDNLRYKGKDVYIGLITTDDVDYTNQSLRTPEGSSRIACIWEQIGTDQGTFFLKEQINQALADPNPGEIIKLPSGDSMSTMMLGIAGGQSTFPDYRGVATEAEFIVAKVNAAPEALQRIFGGTPSKYAIMLADLLIAVLKLIDFAAAQGKPLVLCAPFNTNIDPHDGSLILYEILGLLASRANVTLIVPAGEEADKKHHFSVEGESPTLATVNISVSREGQNMVGILYQRYPNIVTAILYPPNMADQSINLKTISSTPLGVSTIHSDGYKISFLNGAARILFRLENPQVGIWRMDKDIRYIAGIKHYSRSSSCYL